MDLPRSIPHALLARAAALGARPAIGRAEPGRKAVGWDELEREAELFGRGLLARGLKRGERVVLLGEASPEWVAAALGAMGAGGVLAPMVHDWPPALLGPALASANPTVVVAGGAGDWERLRPFCGALPDLRAAVQLTPGELDDKRLGFEQLLARGARASPARWHAALERLEPDAVAVLAFTLGTLGEPRPIALTHRNLLWAGARLARAAGLATDEVLLPVLPTGSAPDLLIRLPLALLLGARVESAAVPGAAVASFERLREVRPTMIVAGPRAVEALAEELIRRARQNAADPRVLSWARRTVLARNVARGGRREPPLGVRAEAHVAEALVQRPLQAREGLDRLRRLYCTGGFAHRRAAEALAGLDLPLLALYGAAEAAGAIAVEEPGEPGRARPLPGVEVRTDHDGRLAARSPAGAASAAGAEGWADTGDWVEIDDDGRLLLRGRHAERLYTAAGTAVAPALVEAALEDEPLIGQAVVFGEGRQQLGALVSLAPRATRAFAQRLGLQEEVEQIASHPALQAALGRALARASRRLGPGRAVAGFRVLPRPLASSAGELNAFGQPRRIAIAAGWSAEIESLLGG